MKIQIVPGTHEDAVKIELHLTIKYEDGSYFVDNKYKHQVDQLIKEGLIFSNE